MIATIVSSAAAAGLVAGGCAYAALAPESQIFGRTIVAGANPAEFALTYDDGPNVRDTPRLLDLLAEFDVRATFFVIGNFVQERPELVKRIHAAGHLIGNHTTSHPWLPLLAPRRVRNELAFCTATIQEATGAPVRFFRPPHGARRPDILRIARSMKLTPVLWNAMGFDWQSRRTAESITASLQRGIVRNQQRGRGSNLLLHDGGHAKMGADRSRSVEATRMILTRFAPGTTRYVTVDAWA